MRKIFIFIAAAFSAFALAVPALAKTDHLRMMSFNVRLQQASDTGNLSWSARKISAVKAVKKQKPDVIGFQEASYAHKLAFMAEMPEYQIVDRSTKPGTVDESLKNNDNPIFFRADKFELLDYGYFWLNKKQQEVTAGWDTASICHATWLKLRFKKSGLIFFVFNTQFDSRSETARLESSNLTASKIKEIAGDDAFVFLTGDFGMITGDKGLRPLSDYLSNAELTAKKPDLGVTCNGFGNASFSGRFDHIFYRNAIVKSFKIVSKGKYDVPYISDHYPVLSDFDVSVFLINGKGKVGITFVKKQ